MRDAPEGRVDRVIAVPVRKVSSVMFGGLELDTLYVTSMAKPPLPPFPDDGQQRGGWFAIHWVESEEVLKPRFAR